MNMEALVKSVEVWAEDRNLIRGSTPLKQVDKTSAEVNELVGALHKMAYEDTFEDGEPETFLAEAADAIGDVVVTLIVIAKQLRIPFEECLAGAYEEIKDRKGKMINGQFVKEADLK